MTMFVKVMGIVQTILQQQHNPLYVIKTVHEGL